MMKRTIMLSLLSVSLLAACNRQGPSAANDLRSFTNQKVNWEKCDPTVLGRDTSKAFAKLGNRLSCADIKIPLDWNKPDRGVAYMSLIRVTATEGKAKQGSIFFNPGGPGGDGLSFAPNYALAWGAADQSGAIGRGLKKLADQYDLIGFSPRGTGNSSRIYCGINELVTPFFNASGDRSQANIDKMIRSGRLSAKACQKNPIAPYINTDQTVRDLDLARQLLGEKKLNFIGYSYGTWLGSWYAKRFPQNTGRMLLDGNMPWHSTTQANWETDPMAFHRSFTQVVLPYLARHDDTFFLGKKSDAIYQRYLQLGEPLRTGMAETVFGLLYGHDLAYDLGIILKTAVLIDDLIKANPDLDDNELLKALATKLPFDAETNEYAMANAAELLSTRRTYLEAKPYPVTLRQSAGTLQAVICNDTPWNHDLNYWRALDEKNAQLYPTFGGSLIAESCVYWQDNAGVKRPDVPRNMPPLLMLQNEYDPATPLEGALGALDSVPNARMILIDNEHQHAAFPYGTDCVDLPIIQYFLTGELPKAKISTCQALPLPGEDQVYPVGKVYAQSLSPLRTQALRQQAFGAESLELINQNRDLIQQNAAEFFGPKR